jgi:EpsG family
MLVSRYKNIVWASVVICVIIFLINITWSKDLVNYQNFFETSQTSTWEELSTFSSDQSIEYTYLFLNKLWPGEFNSFLAVIIYVAICVKLIFFKWVEDIYNTNIWYFVLAYIAFIGLVNDAAQLRIALASGFFMSAVAYYQEGRVVRHSVLILIAALLHGSMVVLVLAFHLFKFFRIFFKPWIFLVFFLVAKLYLLDVSNGVVGTLLEGSRYAHYFNVEVDHQNSTGLFQYFFGALMLVTFLHYQFVRLNNNDKKSSNGGAAASYFSDFCRNSGFMALYMMLLFSQSVPMAVRFAELFLIFFMIDVIQYAKNITKSKLEFNIVFAISVVSIGILRFYHTHIYLNPIFD